MNKARWEDPDIPISVLALKLCEEAAEVGNEITDHHMETEYEDQRDLADSVRYHGKRALRELEHVEHIANVLRDRLTKEIQAASVV